MIDLNGQSAHVLMAVLDDLEPVELAGMRLLARSHPPAGRLLPSTTGINRNTLCRATCELIDYTTRCQSMQARLIDLNPIPLTDLIITDFGL